MANKRISELSSRTPSATDLMLVGDPTTGYSYKCLVSQVGGVTSVFGRTGAVTAQEGDYSLTLLSDVTITSPASGDILTYNGSSWVNSAGGFVPYTGATANVSLGEYGILAGWYRLDTTPTGTPTNQGTIYWDDSFNTAAIIMNGTTQEIGHDQFYQVKNSTGSTIPKGTAVRFAGTDGGSGHLLITPFLADGSNPSSYFMGVTAEAITNGSFGKVQSFGRLDGIDTSAFNEGDILYASTTVAGGFQTTVPQAPNNIILVAAVVSDAVNGKLLIRPTLGSKLTSDESVKITSVANGQVLQYNSSLAVWENVAPSSLAVSNIYTANGTLTGNRTVTSGGFSVNYTGSVFLATAGGTVGIGTTSPAYNLHVQAAAGATTAVKATNTTTRALTEWESYTSANVMMRGFVGTFHDNSSFQIRTETAHPITFSTTNTERMRIFSSGNIGINTTTDAGFRLDVSGTGRYTGSANNAVLTVGVGGSSSNVVIGGHNASTDFTRIQIGNNFSLNRNGGDVSTIVSTLGLSVITEFTNFVNAGNVPGAIRFIGNFGLGTPSIGVFNASDADLLFGNASTSWTYKQNTLARNVLWYQSDSSTSPTKVASAIMSLESTTRGVLLPRMTTTQRNAIVSPATGLIVYDTTDNEFDYYNGTAWTAIRDTNLYNSDGTLTGNRTVTMGANNLIFSGGSSSSSERFQIAAATTMLARPANSSSTAYAVLYNEGVGYVGFQQRGSGVANFGINGISEIITSNTGGLIITTGTNGGPLLLGTVNTERMRIFNTGNIGINTTTDAGFRLDVNGTARFQNTITAAGTITTSSGTFVISRANTGTSVEVLGGSCGARFNGTSSTVASVLQVYAEAGMTIASSYQNITNASALLDIQSTTRGVLLPRMTTTQRNAISSPATGLIVYDTTGNNLDYYNGTQWLDVLASDFLTADNTNDRLGIGTTSPATTLHVNGSIRTANPSGGTAVNWRLGSAITSTVQLDTSGYLEVEVNGTAYKVGLVMLP